jgi:hypothetical protein
MIDCDIYTASKDALAFCAPHIGRYAMIFFDDWGWPQERGEIGQKEAFEEFLTAHREISAEPMPSYLPQARVFLLKRAGLLRPLELKVRREGGPASSSTATSSPKARIRWNRGEWSWVREATTQ